MLGKFRLAVLMLGLASIITLSGCATRHYGYQTPDRAVQGMAAGGIGGLLVGAITGTSSPLSYAAGGVVGGGLAGRLFETKAAVIHRLKSAGVQIIQLGDTVTLILPSDAFFFTDTADLRFERRITLEEIASLLREFGDVPVYIAGFTDNVGSRAFNRKLAAKQAESIASFLWAHGIDFHRLKTKGYGEKPTIASNMTVAGSAMNRHVEIRLRTKL